MKLRRHVGGTLSVIESLFAEIRKKTYVMVYSQIV